jgi:integrase
LAKDRGAIPAAPRIKKLPGKRRRERVVSVEEEARYLAAAPMLIAAIAAVLADTGLRPEECFRLCWESITWTNGRNGTFLVTHGKTAAARRVLPMTARVRTILESRWQSAGQPEQGWVWTAPTYSGHVEGSSLKKQHSKALRLSNVRPFVLYSLRHTFLTRLGRIWLRCMDTRENCWAQLNSDVHSLRPPVGRSGLCGCRKAGWAQNPAQRRITVAGIVWRKAANRLTANE